MTTLPAKRPRALLFDLDGTLVDSRGDIAAACNAALLANGRPALPLETVSRMVGDGARALVARALSSFEGSTAPSRAPLGVALASRVDCSRRDEVADDDLVDRALVSFQRYYLAHPWVHTVVLPGVRELLEEVRTDQMLCAVVTNKPRDVSLALLAALGMADTFGAIRGGGDGPLKPLPDGVQAVLAQLGVAPADAWMIGDGPQDIGAGKAAGCFTVGVPGIAERAHLLASAPDLVCESLHDVRAVLAALTPA